MEAEAQASMLEGKLQEVVKLHNEWKRKSEAELRKLEQRGAEQAAAVMAEVQDQMQALTAAREAAEAEAAQLRGKMSAADAQALREAKRDLEEFKQRRRAHERQHAPEAEGSATKEGSEAEAAEEEAAKAKALFASWDRHNNGCLSHREVKKAMKARVDVEC